MALRLTEKLRIVVAKPCDLTKSPLYFRWLNQLGGWNYWLFERNYTMAKSNGNTVMQNVYRDDYSLNADSGAESLEEKIRTSSAESINVYEDGLTLEFAKLIMTMYDSIQVDLLLNPATWKTESPLFQRVIIQDSTKEIGDKKDNLYDVSFTAMLQPKNLPWV